MLEVGDCKEGPALRAIVPVGSKRHSQTGDGAHMADSDIEESFNDFFGGCFVLAVALFRLRVVGDHKDNDRNCSRTRVCKQKELSTHGKMQGTNSNQQR